MGEELGVDLAFLAGGVLAGEVLALALVLAPLAAAGAAATPSSSLLKVRDERRPGLGATAASAGLATPLPLPPLPAAAFLAGGAPLTDDPPALVQVNV